MSEGYEIYQRVMCSLCLAAVLLLLFCLLVYSIRRQLDAFMRFLCRHPWAGLLLCPFVVALIAYGSTKPEPITPTVRGITLGEPMETPTSVSLEWTPDEGREIKSNQMVRVYWRDASSGGWRLATEGLGIVSATVEGFFVNRDTDWMVEVEDADDEEVEP